MGTLLLAVGVAYAPGKDGRFVIRAGPEFSTIPHGRRFEPCLVLSQHQLRLLSVTLTINPPSPCLPSAPSLLPPYPDPSFGYAPNLKLPRSYQWNLAVEKSFAGSQAVSATYVGRRAGICWREEAFYQPNANFQGEFLLDAKTMRAPTTMPLQLQYRRPVSKGLQSLSVTPVSFAG